MTSIIDTRRDLNQRLAALQGERASWDETYSDVVNYLFPRAGRFISSERNRGDLRRGKRIYDSTATQALRILAAGMMSGNTSPARPWFRLATADADLNRYNPVKLWLEDVTTIMREVFNRSNTYRALHSMYEELGAFGTAVSIVAEDYNNVLHHYPLTVGEYALGLDAKCTPDTIYRELEKPVSAVVSEFGRENCSTTVLNMFDRGNLDAWIPIVHAVEPRKYRDIGKRDNKNMPWRSVYFEQGGDSDKLLRESGFEEFPCIAPRWAVTGMDTYGYSPGMEALGDIRQLQQEQLRKAQGIDYMTRPPLQVPSSLKNSVVDSLPGGVAYFDASSPSSGIRTQFEVRLDLNHLLADIQDVRARIHGAFYSDLFLMLSGRGDARMTATEVAERHEEKMLMLGPVLERLQNEMLDPLVDITFSKMLRAGILPPPPPEMKGMELNVEYVSMLAQAQRAIGSNAIDRFVMNLGQIAQIKPEVVDKFDADEWAEIYSDILGTDPRMIVPADGVALVRKARAEAQQQMQQAQLQNVQSDTASNMASASASNPIDMFSGYNA